MRSPSLRLRMAISASYRVLLLQRHQHAAASTSYWHNTPHQLAHTHMNVSKKKHTNNKACLRSVCRAIKFNWVELSWVERKKRIGIWQPAAGSQWLAARGSRPPCNWWIAKRFTVNARAIIYLRLRRATAWLLLLFLAEAHWLLSLGVIVVAAAAAAFRSIATMIAITRKQHALAVPQIHLKYLKLPLQQQALIWSFCKVQRNAPGMPNRLPQSASKLLLYIFIYIYIY